MIKSNPKLCQQAQVNATLSSCCGFTGETILTDSAIIILFAGILGAGDMFSMISTSLLPLFNGLLILPMALIANKTHGKKLIIGSCMLATFAYFIAASAPLWGRFAVAVLIATILVFALSLPGFIASWFPLLDTFIQEDRRTIFFSRMRFCHQITAVIFLFTTGLLLGRNPAIWKLQLTILCGAFIFAGRALFIARIPAFNTHKVIHHTHKDSFYNVMSNTQLVNFSFYFFILNLASWGAIPLMTIYLKNKLNAPDNIIIMISGLTLTGMLTGYLIAHKLIKLLTVKTTLFLIQISYIIINIIFFCIATGSLTTYIMITVLLAIYSLMTAVSSIIIASGMLALANQENKRISMAFCGALCYSGSGLSRLLSSLLLGSKLFAFNYYIASIQISHYQTLFLIYALSLIAALLWLRLKIDKEVFNQI